ncbi:MAG: type II secretion system protein, partial [Planctomycetota bacterium]
MHQQISTKRTSLAAQSGFTLVELLVVITLMVTLGGILTLALSSAETEARIKRTEADVLTIGQMLQSRVSEVSLGRIELAFDPVVSAPGALGGYPAGTTGLSAAERSRLILMARRDRLRMVLPECRADLLYPPASLHFRTQITGSSAWTSSVASVKAPAQWERMRTLAGLYSAAELDRFRSNVVSDPSFDGIEDAYDLTNQSWREEYIRFRQDYDPDGPGGMAPVVDTLADDTGLPDDRFWTREHESAECLYLILATTELFGSPAIDLIQSSNIGDTDGDGFMEILDAWGTPYEFIRNPSGLRTAGIKNFDPSGSTAERMFPLDPDPLDFLVTDWRYDDANFPASTPAPSLSYRPYYLPPALITAGG